MTTVTLTSSVEEELQVGSVRELNTSVTCDHRAGGAALPPLGPPPPSRGGGGGGGERPSRREVWVMRLLFASSALALAAVLVAVQEAHRR